MKKLILALAASLSLFSVQPAMAGTKIELPSQVQGVLPIPNGGTGATTSTGTVSVVLSTSPTITTPIINTPTITDETLTAGTTTVAPLKLTAGTNNTTAQAGAVEYDGTAFYATASANTRQVVDAEQVVVLSSPYTLVAQTAAQKMFNVTTNGAVNLPVGTYEFETEFSISSMSATTGSFGYALGGTAVFTQTWRAIAVKAVLTTATASQTTHNITANNTLATATTATTGYSTIKGIIRVTTAGTVIPHISLSVASAAIIGTNAYFRIYAIGSATVTTVGNFN